MVGLAGDANAQQKNDGREWAWKCRDWLGKQSLAKLDWIWNGLSGKEKNEMQQKNNC